MHRNSQDLHVCASFVAEIFVKENKLLVLWIPIAFLVCSPKGHFYTDRKTSRERRSLSSSMWLCDLASIPVDFEIDLIAHKYLLPLWQGCSSSKVIRKESQYGATKPDFMKREIQGFGGFLELSCRTLFRCSCHAK